METSQKKKSYGFKIQMHFWSISSNNLTIRIGLKHQNSICTKPNCTPHLKAGHISFRWGEKKISILPRALSALWENLCCCGIVGHCSWLFISRPTTTEPPISTIVLYPRMIEGESSRLIPHKSARKKHNVRQHDHWQFKQLKVSFRCVGHTKNPYESCSITSS